MKSLQYTVQSFDISFHTTVLNIFPDDNTVSSFLLTLLRWNTICERVYIS